MKISRSPSLQTLQDMHKRVLEASKALTVLASDSHKQFVNKRRIASARGVMPAFRWFVSMLVFISLVCSFSQTTVKNATFVPGFGFSFFWYAVGRLTHAPANPDQVFYCYSVSRAVVAKQKRTNPMLTPPPPPPPRFRVRVRFAPQAGCLALSATYMEKSVDDLFSTATTLQNRWRAGTISRYDVVSVFVDDLLDIEPLVCGPDEGETCKTKTKTKAATTVVNPDAAQQVPSDWVTSLNVVTTTWFGSMRVTRASSKDHLRELLLQSSFIPFATGFGLYKKGELDGGFSALFHPRCETFIGLPLTYDIIANSLNVNMGKDVALRLWETGKKKAEEAKEEEQGAGKLR